MVGALVGPNVSPTLVGLAVTGADVGLEDGPTVGAHVCPSVVGASDGAAVRFRGPPTGLDVGDALGAVVPPPVPEPEPEPVPRAAVGALVLFAHAPVGALVGLTERPLPHAQHADTAPAGSVPAHPPLLRPALQ